MPVSDLQELPARLPPDRPRLLGLDVGDKTIGFAVSDAGRRIASPVTTLRRTRPAADLEALLRLVEEREAGGLVLGLPVNMDGTEGPRAEAVRRTARQILGRRDLPLAFWDERLSTAAVERAMIGADLSRAKRARRIDSAAAAWILQGALDALGFGPPGAGPIPPAGTDPDRSAP